MEGVGEWGVGKWGMGEWENERVGEWEMTV